MNGSRLYKTFPLTLLFLTFLAFAPAVRNEFVTWDDPTNFIDNMNYRGLGWSQIHWMWTSHLMNRYIPITWMTLGLDYTVWGMEPFGYHLTSILWHCANAVIFYWLAIALFRKTTPETSVELRDRIPVAAFFTAVLFALHPLRVESVAWVTERRDLVSGLFYLLAILVYVRGVRETPSPTLERKHYWGCFALFVLAILSKEMVVTLPVVMLILDVYPLRRLSIKPREWFSASARMVWLEKLPFFVVSIADSALALYVGYHENVESFSNLSPFGRFAVTIYGLAYYAWKTILPFHLSPMHAITLYRISAHGLPFQLSVVVVVWMIAAALVLRRKVPALPAVLLAYTITLVPVLGIFHNGYQIAADRYSYLPCLGWALLGGGALLAAFQSWSNIATRVAPIVIAVSAIGLGALTWQQTQVWRDSETLWKYCLATDPSSIAYNNIGVMFAAQGDMISALEYLQRAVALDGGNGQAHNNYGNTLLHVEDWEGAAREFQAAKEILPLLVNARWGLGTARMMQGRLDEAIAELQGALQIDPNDKEAQAKLNQALEKKRAAR